MREESSSNTIDSAFGLPRLCRYFSELAPHPMLAVEGPTAIVRHVNAAFLSLSGASREELIGQPFALCVPEGEKNGCVSLLERVYRTGRPESLAEQKHGDRQAAYWTYTVWAILGTDERPAGVMIQVVDSTEIALFRAQAAAMNEALMLGSVRQHELTEAADDLNEKLRAQVLERQRIDDALRESEDRVRRALDAGELGTFNLELATNALTTDARFRAIFGVAEERIDYEGAFAIVHPDDQAKLRDALAAATRPVDSVPYVAEYRIVHPDGSIRWVHARWRATFTGEGVARKLLSFDGTVADITERKRTEDALANSHVKLQSHIQEVMRLNESLQTIVKEREYFIAVLSHELRTPLNPVLLAASMLQKDRRLDADARQIMQMIQRNITLEARLIDDLLDMTRMERGKLNLVRKSVDLRAVMEGAVEVCRTDLDTAELKLTVESGNGAQMIDADAGRLQQVFSNLLRNAIKFTPAGGTIRMRSDCNGDTCTVEVSDSGLGMEADFIPRAFSAFEQCDKSASRKAGLGLGLAICKTIVELHEGTITAQSEGTGRGATFIVTLPTVKGVAGEAAEKTPAPSELARPVKSLHILLVEDHADTARLMRRLLAIDGHEVRWAADVATALQLAATLNFDLLLSDLGLPDGTGVDLMRSLREKGSLLPGIILSGYGQDRDIERSLEAGFTAHLVKPLSLQKLHQAMATLVA